MKSLSIIGGGLSGCEAAWHAAERGISVTLYEMRPTKKTDIHQSSNLGEIVCSNSFGSQLVDRSSGLLMRELEILDSLLIRIAKSYQLPAGHALAIDRERFSNQVTKEITSHKNIRVIRKEIIKIPDGVTLIASGPLTSEGLANSITDLSGQDNLYFFDAVAPIIEFDSIDMKKAFWGSRYSKGVTERGDYINCPFDDRSYENFIHELINAERIELRSFEKEIPNGVKAGKGNFFEGCLPIEIMAERGARTLAFGPLRPIGLTNPHANIKPVAIVQLRQDDMGGKFFNLVGFQTNLKYKEQSRVFRLIPGLENASFIRYGQMHRNTFINSPSVINESLQLRDNKNIFFCGQITGVEGYLSNIASGLFAGLNCERYIENKEFISFPETTMIGALHRYISTGNEKRFQPMKANFGLLPPLAQMVRKKSVRFQEYSRRAVQDMEAFLDINEI